MKLHIYKTNRRIKESEYLVKCAEQDGKLGNIEVSHYTFIDDITSDSPFKLDPGSNVKVYNDFSYIGDELNKPGVFDKLARFVRGQK
jgi:hypothetical protein